MSLIDSAMEKFNIMDRTTTPDGYGGVITSYVKGAEISVAMSIDSSTEARVAAVEGVKNRYTLFTRKTVTLKFPDIVQRQSDGKYYRITSDGTEKHTPGVAGLDLRAVEAEEWEFTSNG